MKKKSILFFISLILLGLQAHATHIVGGVINYRHLSGLDYEVVMKIYRDTNGSAGFDGDPCGMFGGQGAPLGIYTDNGQLYTVEFLCDPVITNVVPNINNTCLIIPPNIGVEEGVYTDTITLPNGNFGYHLVYQRCCRNGTINNIQVPGNTGATYTAYIPPTNTYMNSNPEFNLFPPLFICQNAPMVFNHSATDLDGDSLVYELCTPLTGGSTFDPAPNPPLGPPFTDVQYLFPFGLNNLLGGTPLTIDPNTGVLTGTPNALGQFVVGVCVSEYRNGMLLSTTLRDFQFNVTTCNIPTSNIPSNNIDPNTGIGDFVVNCNDLSVSFINNSNGAVSYFWDFGDPNSTLDTSSQFEPSYTYQDTGVYLVTLIATNANNCVDTAQAWVRMFPVFTPGFDFSNVCADSAVLFIDTSATTYGAVSSWNWDFGDNNSSVKQNPGHQYNSAGIYNVSLEVSTDKGCNETVTGQVTVYPLPSMNFQTTDACLNTPYNFVDLSSGAPVSYYWNFGNGDTSLLQNPDYTFSSTGTQPVLLAGSNALNCKDTVVKNIFVNPLPAINIANDTSICPESSVQLSASGGVSYSWTPNINISNNTISSPLATPDAVTTYVVEVEDANGCIDTDSMRITFHTPPPAEAGTDTSVCLEPGSFRDSVQLLATGGVSYAWSPGEGLSDSTIAGPISRPPFNTVYYVTVTDTNSCTAIDSVLVYFLDPQLDLIADVDTELCIFDTIQIPVIDQGVITSYSWSPAQDISDPNVRDPLFHPQNTTDYILSVQNYCYVKNDTVTVIVNPLPDIQTGTLDSICIGESIQLTANGGISYNWDNDPTLSNLNIPNPVASPATTTTYYVTVVDDKSCENRDSVTIEVNLPPEPITFIDDTRDFICFGQSVRLVSTGGVSYVWVQDPTLSDLDVADPYATPADTAQYFVEVTNIHGCDADDTIQVNVQPKINPIGSEYYESCEGDFVQLNVSGGFYYRWVPSEGLNYSNVPRPTVLADSSTTYKAYISNDCFVDSIEIELYVNPLPSVDAGPDKTINRELNTILEGMGDGTFLWLPIEGLDDPTIENPTASPFNTTNYQLRVQDAIGCVSFDTMTVTVIPKDVLLLPTGFSPNNDGFNDKFRIVKHLNIDEIVEFSVFNRWGERVFQGQDINASWDGSHRGKPQDMGVYLYQIKYINLDGKSVESSGNVTLLR